MARIEIVEPREAWREAFAETGRALRDALGAHALAVHHIGSTAVPGLAAKDVIDVQVTVARLDAPVDDLLAGLGFARVARVTGDHAPHGSELPSDELAKRLYRRDAPATNLHVREEGRFNQRYALLCRDHLRAAPEVARAYEEIKRQLARRFPDDVDAYYAVKDPVFDLIVAAAERWAAQTGWAPPPSDA